MIVRGAAQGDSLRVAIPKGALFDDAVEMLGRAGFDVRPLRSCGRSLIVRSSDAAFVIAKPTDVPVYVAYGAVDVAIAGKDVLEEAALEVVELVDLGFGACRFVVAEPAEATRSAAELYRHLGQIRVATKYPRITERHFAERGLQVEIIKLAGNIEIAPLIGIADWIVDITATGTTLRENGLRVVEEVMESTARFVANPASLATKTRLVTEMAERLEAAVRPEKGA